MNGLARKRENQERMAQGKNHDGVRQEHTEARARLLINDLTKMGIKELRELGAQYGINHDELIALKSKNSYSTYLNPIREKAELSTPMVRSKFCPMDMDSCVLHRIHICQVLMISIFLPRRYGFSI